MGCCLAHCPNFSPLASLMCLDCRDLTPVETPEGKRRDTAKNMFGFVDCPACMPDKYSKTCACCGGGKKVTAETARQWKLDNGLALDSERP